MGRVMCDLTKCGSIAAPPSSQKGIAFDIADLVIARGWAGYHDFQMVVSLNHGATAGEEYEEVIAFHAKTGPLHRLIMWRNAEAVLVQPLVGRARQFWTVAEALESMLPGERVTVTDLTAASWPLAADGIVPAPELAAK